MTTLEAIVEKRASIEDGSTKEEIAFASSSTRYQRMVSPTASVTENDQRVPFSKNPKVGGITRSVSARTPSGVGFRATGRKPPRMTGSPSLAASSKASHMFSEPLASEGEGSVFPVDLPLSNRRAFEVEIIQRFDKLAINPNVGDFWVIMDATWMNHWIDFVMGKADPPGAVSNTNLFDEVTISPKNSLLQQRVSRRRDNGKGRSGLKLKSGLQLVKNYRVVHPLVWFIYREIYNTDDAPMLCRQKADLYSEEISVSRRHKVEDEAHTKAVYEIRRFVAWLKKERARKGNSVNE